MILIQVFFDSLLMRIPGELYFKAALLLGYSFTLILVMLLKNGTLSMGNLALIVIFLFILINNQTIIHGSIFPTIFCFVGITIIICCKYVPIWMKAMQKAIIPLVWIQFASAIILFFNRDAQKSYVIPFFALDSVSANNLVRQIESNYLLGLTSHFSAFAIYLSIGFLYAYSRFLSSGTKRKKSTITMIAFFLGLAMSGKRAHFAFCLIAAIYVYIVIYGTRSINRIIKRFLIVFCAALFLFIVLSTASVFQTTLTRIIAQENADVFSGRIIIWEPMWRDFLSSPFIGSGWGAFRYNYSYLMMGNDRMTDGHNVYLQLLYETGILGFLAIGSLFFISFRKTYQLYRIIQKDPFFQASEKELMLFSVSMQLFFLMYCMTGNPLYDFIIFFPYIFACSVPITVKYNRERKALLQNEMHKKDIESDERRDAL